MAIRDCSDGIREAAVVELDGHHYALIVDLVEDVVEALSDPMPVRAAMGAGWERASQGMVETENGPLLVVDVAALIGGVAEARRSLSSSLPLPFNNCVVRSGKFGMKSCLIVDDSKVIRKVARHILETLEFEVDEAGDGQEALSRCEAKMPDVVLLDWNMPVMSGMEFLKLLRQRGHDDQPKVVFCTTENDMAHIRAALEAGADEYVMKPFDRETLHIKLQLVGVA